MSEDEMMALICLGALVMIIPILMISAGIYNYLSGGCI